MTTPILHAYDASPFTQRALRMLGIKNLDWRWVETPMMPPKDELLALTGGYRGTPVLQFGSDIYIDSQLIALELEKRFPQPSLFADAGSGLPLALFQWSDAFFRQGLKIVLALQADSWPAPFRADREQLFPDIDFAAAKCELAHSKAQYRAHASLLDRQLADGRRFLAGTQAGVVDAQVHPFIWLLRTAAPEVADPLLGGFAHLITWEARVAALGEGRRNRIDAAVAILEAKDSLPDEELQIDLGDAQALRAGMRVRVIADDTRRGEVEGEVTIALPDRVSIRRVDRRVGEVVVHFPRRGYRIVPS
jgi:glutathione S-transferase